MTNDLSLSQCGRFLTIDLLDDWDINSLKLMTFQAHLLQQAHKNTRILIKAKQWLTETLTMESILLIGDSLSRLVESNWRIAVVTPSLNNKNTILENMLNLKGIELLHFDHVEKAETWLLKNNMN